MAEINLLKSELGGQGASYSEIPKGSLGLTLVIVLLVLEGLAYGGLWYFGRNVANTQAQTRQSLSEIDLEISQEEEGRLEAISFQRRLRNLRTLIDQHAYWTALLEEVARSTYVPATYTDFNASQLDSMIFLAGTIPSYTDLGKLMLGLEQSAYLEDVVVLASGQGSERAVGYSFELQMKFDPKLLLK